MVLPLFVADGHGLSLKPHELSERKDYAVRLILHPALHCKYNMFVTLIVSTESSRTVLQRLRINPPSPNPSEAHIKAC